MDAILYIALGMGLFLAGMGIERARRAGHDLVELEKNVKEMQREIEESRELLINRRIPYGVVQDIENRQARAVDRLMWAKDAMEQAELAMKQEIDLYNFVLGRDPLEGDGRERHKVRR
jgi:hypothetical protein